MAKALRPRLLSKLAAEVEFRVFAGWCHKLPRHQARMAAAQPRLAMITTRMRHITIIILLPPVQRQLQGIITTRLRTLSIRQKSNLQM
jgi:hypothetical protein